MRSHPHGRGHDPTAGLHRWRIYNDSIKAFGHGIQPSMQVLDWHSDDGRSPFREIGRAWCTDR
ncbi:hypothetical protein, partial [Gordonia sp. UBA7860]|uniref:hypothetical protein n=1 Tax=Gordonia sp. UBA7860 TaxID=1946579 RepID=UPI00257D4FE7